MGVLNVTPDSFFDRGLYLDLDKAIQQGEQLIEEGAELIDIGGESSRPGSKSVALDVELKRVVPVLKKLIKRFPKIQYSIDTQKSEVAHSALSEGARIINDVSSLRNDPKMISVIKKFNPILILMHMQGSPFNMQKFPFYKNVVKEIKDFLKERIKWAMQNGVPKTNLWIDPGIGFGKNLKHNLEILKNLKDFLSLKCPLVLGCSRKSFIGFILGGKESPCPPEERLEGSLAAAAWGYLEGASILRVHDVLETKRTIRVLQAIQAK
ncbi:MAG: dihydropteroate synthase [Elusimicrobia bacterium RIFCSPLOWO2_02_FULL_39_32]|nr:MAG: dihydropteroate synthase [Elusimicrobia bacterium GWA2_38_7]OGR81261.1 MAG: dihydropteroate synthase [Elusimicrobia bacterium RIFCSPHIGHO2_02_FULL_39_36]OGR91813.1 MAG: dihydropteroate synthase [Elusimicrobia bacterium RIFCSPLOWO2_02_FULL_39_32]OGR98472.1 MAG: dihydropteroate synthase [Elusimicrobia bacterium RIFCSPLOWO2_12_FULL_39_28]